MDILGIRIPTVVSDSVARRCDGCLEVIEGTPWRINVLDTLAPETPASWASRTGINPGPFEFHGDAGHVRAWMRRRGDLLCRKGVIREIMRPVAIPGPEARWGLCDGLHRDAHEFIPA
jgi:hypothetical protein